MDNLLRDLYEGDINPSMEVKHFIEEYAIELRAKTNAEDEFCAKLDKDMQNEFYDILERWIKVYPMELREAYINGYKLGARMMAEVYSK